MADADLKISHGLRGIAEGLDQVLADIAGQRVNFSLFVWTEGRGQYVANCLRPDVIKAIEETLARWKAGMPDVPTHQVQ